MRRFLVASVAAITGSLALAQDDKVILAFQSFMQQFQKSYTAAEKLERFEIFAKNFQFIVEENAKGNSYELGITPFADLTQEEFRQHFTGFNASQKPFGKLPYLGRHERSLAVLPAAVDWTTAGAVTPVKNQAQCGSCWSFSATGALEGAWKVAGNTLVSISEQQLVDCSGSFGNQGCNGGQMDAAFQYAQANGMCTEDSYPYEAKDGTCRTSTCKVAVPQGSVVGFKDVAKDDTQALMDAVAQQPVSVAIEANLPIFQLYKSGVLSGICGATLDHGVLAVGYGTENNQDYWLVKNSWGATWGLNGYVKLLRGKTGAGECGIKSDASYPVMKSLIDIISV